MTVDDITMYPTEVEYGTLDEIRDAALAALPPEVADFLEGGAGQETTLRRNREAFLRYRVLPTPMSGVTQPDTRTTLLGIDLDSPVLIAPFGGDTLFHPDGHRAAAAAAASSGIVDIVPEAGSFSYEDVRAVAPRSARIAQLHPFENADAVVRRIAAAGYEALCVTVDCPVAGYRTRNKRNRFDPPAAVFGGNGTAETADGPRVAEVMGALTRGGLRAWTWADLTGVMSQCGLPWIAKGVLTVDAARRALDAGASALVVSNHGGRQLDPAPSSVEVLPRIRAAVGPGTPILLDSGIRTGADVYVALALGADAVILGRAAIYGLAAGGAHGVQRVIELIDEELRTLMTLSGTPALADITADRVIGVRG